MKPYLCRLAIGLLLGSTNAGAANLLVTVVDPRGHGIADAVVTVDPVSTSRLAPRQPAPAKTVDQKDLAFLPYLEIFRPGDAVVFRNSDRTRHHVYSFSPTRQFEFVLAPGQRSPPMRLDKPGIVAVGCNIHDQMIAYLVVSDAPWIGRSGADGHVAIHDLAAGAYTVRVWQPRMRPGRPNPAQSLRVGPGADDLSLRFSVALLPDPRSAHDGSMAY